MLSQDQRLHLDAMAVLSYLIIARLIEIRPTQYMWSSTATNAIGVLKMTSELLTCGSLLACKHDST